MSAIAESGYTIAAIDKDSGIVTTTLVKVDEATGDRYADCGSAPLASTVATATQVSFLVRHRGEQTEVQIRATFKREREFDGNHRVVDCVSTGALEADVRKVLDRTVSAHPDRVVRIVDQAPTSPTSTTKFYCTAAPADAMNAACARSMPGCEKRQAEIAASAGDATACEEIASAVCLHTKAADGTPGERCFPGFNTCDVARKKLIEPDRADAVGACEQVQ